MHHNNSNKLEATYVKLSEKIHYFITAFIDVWQQFAYSYCFVTGGSKERKSRFVINEILILISIKLLIFWFDKGNFMLSKMLPCWSKSNISSCAFIKFIFRVTFFKPFMTNLGVNGKLKYTHSMDVWVYFSFPLSPKFIANL